MFVFRITSCSFSDLSALDVNVMFVHVFVLVLMGLLTALRPWVGLACSTYLCMQLCLLIMTTLIITTLISSHLIASSLSLSYLHPRLLSLSLSLSRISISINIIAITSAYQHIRITPASAHQHISTSAHQHISTSAHQHISTITSHHQHHQHHIKLDPC